MPEAAPITLSLGFILRMIPPITWSLVGEESRFLGSNYKCMLCLINFSLCEFELLFSKNYKVWFFHLKTIIENTKKKNIRGDNLSPVHSKLGLD